MGYIKPIYKKNGDKMDPKHYRPVTIPSCRGKLFYKCSPDWTADKILGWFFTLDNLFVLL
jgi:hypothetical protein